METYQSKTRAKTITAVVTIVVIIGVVVLIEVLQHNASATPAAASTTSSATTTPTSTSGSSNASSAGTSGSSSSTSTTSSSYKDGTYAADVQYYVPHGYEDIKVTLTVANGVVTNSSIVNSGNDRDSVSYQDEFTSAYKSKVVGKSLSGLSISYIAGASDTTQGFNDAVAKIRTEATA